MSTQQSSNVKRITRLLALMQQLQSGQGDNAKGLAEACGMSSRTVFRDLGDLREAGVPVKYNETSKQYRIDSAHYLKPTNLTLEEALSIVLLAERIGQLEAESIFSAAADAAAKIQASLPAAMQDSLDEVAEAIDFRPPPTNPLVDKGEVYRELLAASVRRQTVHLRYDCFTEWQTFESEFEPYHLFFHERSWYAIGRTERHDEVRTLNLSRIGVARRLDKRFEKPASFSLKKHFRNAWRLIPDDEPDSEVHLHFSSLVARNVAEVMWHPTQRTEFREDGSMDFRVTVTGIREIVWWILGYGDQVKVVEPEPLYTLVARRLRAAADRYGTVPRKEASGF